MNQIVGEWCRSSPELFSRAVAGESAEELYEATIERVPLLHPEFMTSARKAAQRQALLRRSHSARLGRSFNKRFAVAFRIFDELMAACEIANRRIVPVAADHLKSDAPFLFDEEELFGGPMLKCIVMAGLHGRAITLCAEIVDLLSLGHVEAASARVRTLYEGYLVSAAIGMGSETRYDICERYYLWTHAESASHCGDENPDEDSLRGRIQEEWGPSFFRQYGWARPLFEGLTERQRITFSDLEARLSWPWMMGIYKELNEAVHVGPSGTIRRANFMHANPIRTRAVFDAYSTGKAAYVTVTLLSIVSELSIRVLASETGEVDEVLWLAPIKSCADNLLSDLSKIGYRYMGSTLP